jgi:predicted Zn-dependent protease with MMP-like domain
VHSVAVNRDSVSSPVAETLDTVHAVHDRAVIEMSVERFEELVGDALDSIPEALARLIDNVVVVLVDDEDPEEPDLLGLYEGVPLTERDGYGLGGGLPDRITIFRLPILAACDSDAAVVNEVRVTVVHEVAHHFGIDDVRLHELGWS